MKDFEDLLRLLTEKRNARRMILRIKFGYTQKWTFTHFFNSPFPLV